jgi:general secretion pathway protein D
MILLPAGRLRFVPCALLAVLAFLALGARADAQTRPGATTGARTGTTTGRTGTTTAGRTTGGATGNASGARQYRSNTLLGDATIQVDPETRSIVIVTDEDTHRELAGVIKTLDQPKPQVLIKVVFVEVTYNNGSDIGVEGSYTFNLGKGPTGATTGTNTNTTTTNSTNATTGATTTNVNAITETTSALASAGSAFSSLFGAPAQGSFVRLMTDDWSATLHALETKGKVEILSRPSIMARNNQQAVIVVGSEVPFITNSIITDTGLTNNTVSYDNVGIILKVTPFITSENQIEMIVAPEISALTDQTVPISNTASAPVISKRSAETVVVTPNARTVVIGGLMQTQRTSSVQKIPLLGDIPYLGAAFRRTIKNDVKQELMIFLTPYIVNTEGKLVEITQKELDRTELMKDSFSQGDLRKYMDLDEEGALPAADEKEVRVAMPVMRTSARVRKTSGTTTTSATIRRTTVPAAPPGPPMGQPAIRPSAKPAEPPVQTSGE